MAKRGTAHLSNATVLPSGPYLISSATFPTYFLKDKEKAKRAACEVDIEIFAKHLAPRLGITHRFVGSEPLSPLTAAYNAALTEKLPRMGIELCEIERVTRGGEPISASGVRELIRQNNANALAELMPSTTLEYLQEKKRL